jgi:tripartite-type tricarboxylate transporter receptor subunit TctC
MAGTSILGSNIAQRCLGSNLARATMMVLISFSMCTVSFAQADFYRGRTIQLIVPFSPGGYYDIAGRIVARHLPKYIEGSPSVVV